MKNKIDELIAKKEPPVTGGELLAELKPFFDEYFLGTVVQEGQSIIYHMPNGQTWEISAKLV